MRRTAFRSRGRGGGEFEHVCYVRIGRTWLGWGDATTRLSVIYAGASSILHISVVEFGMASISFFWKNDPKKC